MPISWDRDWIYMGTDYLRMQKLEKKLTGKRVSISLFIKEETENQRPKILKWNAKMRDANNDSLYWWMTHLAGRNNVGTKFYIYLIQIAALRRYIEEHLILSSEDILIICEDTFLLNAIYDNLHPLFKVKKQPGHQILLICEKLYYLLRAIYILFRQIIWFCKHKYMANKTRPIDLQPPTGEVYVIHQCLDDAAFQNGGKIACRYFTVLPEWLENQGKKVYRIPWLFNVTYPLKDVYLKLRTSNCFIPEDWLTWKDYIFALWNGFKSSFTITRDVPFENIDISALLDRERYLQKGDGLSGAMFWRYWRALDRWSSFLDRIVFIEHYEVMPPEHVQAYWAHCKKPEKSFVIGYYHSVFSKEFLACHLPPGEDKSKIFPDLIVTNGSLGKEVLIKQGFPENKLKEGPALRQTFLGVNHNPSCKRALLVLVPLITHAAKELLDKIALCRQWLYDNQIPVLVKKHPMMKKEFLLSIMGWNALPDNWHWHDGEIYTALIQSKCSVILSTASGIDALLSGCIVIPLLSEFGNTMNSVDVLEDHFPVVSSISVKEILNRLNDIYFRKTQYFENQTEALREVLLKGINEINNDTLKAFLI
ncbi:MAG: hypothetical protein N2596_08505 [Syntrophorhabdaceae bacterium]|nr:hypothetical protein [Syntrophorhabdaceae bacterium]